MCMHLNPEMKNISLKEMIATTGRKINILYSLDKDDICVGAETEVKHVYYCPLFTP